MQSGGNEMLDFTDRESIRKFIKENGIKDMIQLNILINMIQLNILIKQMTGTIIEEMLEVERESYLGYPKHKCKPAELKEDGNSRNGYTPKTVRSSHSDIKLDIPRDRNGDFEPELIRKYENDISQIEDKIISMYARLCSGYRFARRVCLFGISSLTLRTYMEHLYQHSLRRDSQSTNQTISNMTDSILPALEEWRNRSLKEIYSIVYIDGQRFKVRSDGTVKDKTVYMVLAIDLEGHKDLLGLWISETESAKYWLSVLTEIRNRGVKDILIITSDDLSGIEEAIASVYPETEYQD